MMNQMNTFAGERPYSRQLVGPALARPYQEYEAIYQLVCRLDAALERGVHLRINGGPALFALGDVVQEILEKSPHDPRRD